MRSIKIFYSEKNQIGKNNKYNQRLKALEEKYNFKEDTIIQLKELFLALPANRLLIIVGLTTRNMMYQF